MATQPQILHGDPAQQPPVKAKRKRSPSVAKPAFFIIQIMDEHGNPMQFDKKRVKLLRVERNADQVLEMVESGEHPFAFYLRGIVPVTRQAAPRATPAQAQTPTAA
jgi:hypothetical protein